MKTKERHFGLDLIRAIAILFIVFGHSRHFLTPVDSILLSVPLLSGVDIFFVLSGYLIGTRFIQQANNENGVQKEFGKKFLKHAAVRLLPMYYLFLAINIWFYIYLSPENILIERYIASVFFIQNVFVPHMGFFWESWSLSITVWFYVLLTVSMVWMTIKFRSLQFKKFIFFFIVIIVMIAFAFRIGIHLQGGITDFYWDVKIRKFLPTRIDSPFYGLLIAWLRFYFPQYFKKMVIPGLIIAVALFSFKAFSALEPGTWFRDVFYPFTSPITYALLIPAIMQLRKAPVLLARPVTWISLISFAIYLTNLLISVAFSKWFNFNESNAWWLWVFYWVLVIVASGFVYQFYELQMRKQFDKWKRNGINFRPIGKRNSSAK